MVAVAAFGLLACGRGASVSRVGLVLVGAVVGGGLLVWLAGRLVHLVGSSLTRRAGVVLGSPAAVAASVRIVTLLLDGVEPLLDGKIVTEVHPVEEGHRANLRWFAGALARHGNAPVHAAVGKLAPRGRVTDVVNDPVDGLSGSVDRHPVLISVPVHPAAASDPTVSQVSVTVDGRDLGSIEVADHVSDKTRAALESLAEHGVVPLVAGADDLDRVTTIASRAEIDHTPDAPSVQVDTAVLRVAADDHDRRLELRLHQADVRVESVVAAVNTIIHGRRLVARIRAARIVIAVVVALAAMVVLLLG